MSTEFTCPACGVTARNKQLLAPGTAIRCPACACVFRLGGTAALVLREASYTAAPPPVQRQPSSARHDLPDLPPPAVLDRQAALEHPPRPPSNTFRNVVIAGIVVVLLLSAAWLAINQFFTGRGGSGTPPAPVASATQSDPTPTTLGSVPEPPRTSPARPDPVTPAAIDPMAAGKPTDARLQIGPRATPAADALPAGGLSPEAYDRVAKATVTVRVTTGSVMNIGHGFFAGPDVVVTTARVLGLASPDDPPPSRVEVVLTGSDAADVTVPAVLRAVDHAGDLAVLKVPAGATAARPAPLAFATARPRESQAVYMVGNATTITGVRTTPEGEPDQLRLAAGPDAVQNGSPVVDAAGRVVGVAVGGPEAVPAGRVAAVLDGRLSLLVVGEPVPRLGALVVPVEVQALDPLQRMRVLAIDWWWGDPTDSVPASRAAPPAGSRQTVALTPANAPDRFTATLGLPTAIPANKVLWLQPHYFVGDASVYMQGEAKVIEQPADPTPTTLAFAPQAGRNTLALTCANALHFRNPAGEAKTLALGLDTRLNEEVCAADEAGVVTYRLAVADRKLTATTALEGQVRPNIADAALAEIDKVSLQIFLDRTGDLTNIEPDAGGAANGRALERLALQVGRSIDFASLKPPGGLVQPGQTWAGRRELPIPLPARDLTIATNVLYTYRGVRTVDGRPLAVVSVNGRLDQRDAARGTVNGTLWVDAQGRVAKATVTVDTILGLRLPETGDRAVQARSRYEVKLTRQ